MPRYIDAEQIPYRTEYNPIRARDPITGEISVVAMLPQHLASKERIDLMPTADVQEVIRCKDCKYYRESKLLFPNKFCFRLLGKDGKPVGYNFSGDDFCSHGERKDSDEK